MWRVSLAITPERAGPRCGSRAVTISGAKRSRRKVDRALVGERLDDRLHRVGAALALGDQLPQAVWSGSRRRRWLPGSSRAGAWQRRSPRPRRRRRGRRPRSAPASRSARPRRGSTSPRPPPSIIAGPPMPSETFSVATIRSEQPAITALPAKQRPATIGDPRHQAREPGPEREGAGVERGDDRVVGVARPPAAALGEEDGGQAHALDQLEEAVLLAVAEGALGAGEDRVVVGEHRAGGALAEEVAVDARGARRSSRRPACARSAPRPRAARAGRRSRSARTRRRSRGRRGRRRSRARCGRRRRGAARPPRREPRPRSAPGGAAARRASSPPAPLCFSSDTRGMFPDTGRLAAGHW